MVFTTPLGLTLINHAFAVVGFFGTESVDEASFGGVIIQDCGSVD